MPNLNQIYRLKAQFYQLSPQDKSVRDYIEKTKAKDVIKKAFDSEMINESKNETRMYSFLTESLNPAKPNMIKYFEEGRDEDVVLLFIDITSFSKSISGWSNTKIKEYLDDYYEKIIPIIYENGGQIEKLMGDGIICVFGKPFLDLDNPEYVYNAEYCAETVIKKFYNTNKSLKVAIHKGKINYYKVPGEFYGEYTMIGQPITELYRLESVAQPNSINFFAASLYDKLGWKYSRFNSRVVKFNECEISKLQGVDFNRIKYLNFPNYF